MDGLPKQFVSSLRILFDILDENRTGFVRLKDIESRWSDDGVRGLPAGVVDGLRRVSPSDGLLSFDRFVAGLKLVLNKKVGNEIRKPFTSKENRVPNDYSTVQSDALSHKNNPYVSESHSGHSFATRRGPQTYNITQEPLYNPILKKIDTRHNSDSQMVNGRINENERTASGQPSYRSQRDESPSRRETTFGAYTIKADVPIYPMTTGSHQGPSKQAMSTTVYSGMRGFPKNSHHPENPPVVPPRTGASHAGTAPHTAAGQMKKSHSGPELHHYQTPPALPPRMHRPNTHVLTDLKNWQEEWTANQRNAISQDQWNNKRQRIPQSGSGNHDGAIYANIDQFQRKSDDPSKQQIPQKATVRRHGSGRRHTLSSGIDHNMMKRMKQLEEEKAVLQAGLAMVDTAREWYMKQLASIGDKQAMLGKVSYNDNSLEAHQERMSFQKARVAEVNQQLQALVESSEKGFPLHMNLAMTSRPTGGKDTTVTMTNRKLMEEMNHKSNQISQMEKEKATLIRELFEARSKNKVSHDDTTFM